MIDWHLRCNHREGMMRRALLSGVGGLLAGISWGCCPAEDSTPAASETEATEALIPAPDPHGKPDEVSPRPNDCS
jgi:hypothetical protein